MIARKDFDIISEWIKPNSRILDLGCGDGSLLKLLNEKRNVTGYGIDNSMEKIIKSFDNGINIINTNINENLKYFSSNKFNYVVLAQSLQVVDNPVSLIKEMLRVGNEAIISFPNMGYWKSRAYLLLKGEMPVTDNLPYSWHSTPNIHLCTINDFKKMCYKNKFQIVDEVINNSKGLNITTSSMSNLFGTSAIFKIR
ncbi:MAG: methionine biosynthesis protein MetW [Gammaproteobacteria bacterium]